MTKPGIELSVETITPAAAKKYLEANKGNRAMTRAVVRGYADAIRAGHWLVNGESIKFDRAGGLVDGQHRLAAIVMSEKAVETVVVRGLDPSAFKTLDQGRARSSSDLLGMRGILYPAALASSYRFLYRWLGRGLTKRRITNTELLDFVDEWPRMTELGYECMRQPLDAVLIDQSRRMFFFFLADAVAPQLARAFLSAVAGRDGAASSTKAVVILNGRKLRAMLAKVQDEIVKPDAAVKWTWLVQAWNATVAGRDVDRFSRTPTPIDFDPKPKLT